jgi:H+/Cl- antiporter ClcA
MVSQWRKLLRWLAICLVLSVLIGSLVAFFLWALDQVTALQWRHSWILLPIGGAASGWLYYRFGRDCEAGNSLIYAQVKLGLESETVEGRTILQSQDTKVPWRMAPLVLLATLVTHLFGGSAGREGTAVQMGGALASGLARWLRLTQADTATLLQAGVAGGFGAVFGTPLAATIFALEVVGRGVSKFASLPACLFAAVVADGVTSWWGIEHTIYRINSDAFGSIEFLTVIKIVAIGVAFGAASWLFLQSTHQPS